MNKYFAEFQVDGCWMELAIILVKVVLWLVQKFECIYWTLIVIVIINIDYK